MGKVIGPVTDVVIGRNLWQEWSEYWPRRRGPLRAVHQPGPQARRHQHARGRARLEQPRIEGDPVDYVRALREDGRGRHLRRRRRRDRALAVPRGVVDRLILTTHPVVAAGRRLFDESVPVTRLELLDAVSTSVGNVILTYRLRGED